LGTAGNAREKIRPDSGGIHFGLAIMRLANLLNFLKKLFGYDRLMLSRVKFLVIFHKPYVELVLKEIPYRVLAPKPSPPGAESRLVQEIGNLGIGIVAGSVELKSLANNLGFLRDNLGDTVRTFDVTERETVVWEAFKYPGQLTFPGFPGQVLEVPVGKDRQDVELEAAFLGGEIEAVLGENHYYVHLFQGFKIGQDVVEVAGEPVKVVGHNSVSFALVNHIHHLLETRASVGFTGVDILADINNGPRGLFPPEKFPAFSLLSFQGMPLFLLLRGNPEVDNSSAGGLFILIRCSGTGTPPAGFSHRFGDKGFLSHRAPPWEEKWEPGLTSGPHYYTTYSVALPSGEVSPLHSFAACNL